MNEPSSFNWKTVIQYGLIGGIITLYLSAVGMVDTFSARNLIGTFLSMGDVMIMLGAFGAGLTIHHKFQNETRNSSLLAGFVAGLSASLPLIFIVILSQLINIRAVFRQHFPSLDRRTYLWQRNRSRKYNPARFEWYFGVCRYGVATPQ
ncbi:MAG: hypothetical protein HC806_02480 [Anaerolineae bacterium]|nr:hypothetical protein [Anaerolineae bacterium]